MKVFDFGFIDQRAQSTTVDTTEKATRPGCSKRDAPLPAPHNFPLTLNEGERFLRIVAQSSRIERHYDLFQLLQGEEIQRFIPHQVLISAWGDFDGPDLKLDVISAIPGMRTGLVGRCCTVDGLLKDLYKRWLRHGRQPLLLDGTACAGLAHSACNDCALHRPMQDRWSLLVHGVINAREGSNTLYVALNKTSIINGHNIKHFRPLAEMLITQIDVAFRRIVALKSPVLEANQAFPASPPVLTAREEEILLWVSEGKTNIEIADLLAISSFTVKNHMRRIMQKLNTSNRTEAVAKYRQMGLLPQRKQTTRETTQDCKTLVNA